MLGFIHSHTKQTKDKLLLAREICNENSGDEKISQTGRGTEKLKKRKKRKGLLSHFVVNVLKVSDTQYQIYWKMLRYVCESSYTFSSVVFINRWGNQVQNLYNLIRCPVNAAMLMCLWPFQ